MSYLKHDWSFSRKKNEFHLRKDVFTKFSLNLLSGSGEGRFLKKIIKVLSLIFYQLPFKGKSFTQWCLCKIWLQFSLAGGSGERKF